MASTAAEVKAANISTWGGIPVLGRPSDTVRIAGLVDVNHVLVISGLLVGGELRRLVDDCKSADSR